MKYFVLTLMIALAACKKDESLEISALYLGSAVVTNDGQPDTTTLPNVKVEVKRISGDSLFFLQRIPFTVPVGVVEDSVRFGAIVENSGSFIIPACKDTLRGGVIITITGSGEISKGSLTYATNSEQTGLTSHVQFTGAAQ